MACGVVEFDPIQPEGRRSARPRHPFPLVRALAHWTPLGPALFSTAKTSGFQGAAVQARFARSVRASSSKLVVRAQEGGYIREYPVPEFIAEVTEAFPDKMIANAEEARVLFSELGYKFLDVRPEAELDATGKVKQCINIPIMNAKFRYDTEKKEKVLEKSEIPEEEWLASVAKVIPDKSTPFWSAVLTEPHTAWTPWVPSTRRATRPWSA